MQVFERLGANDGDGLRDVEQRLLALLRGEDDVLAPNLGFRRRSRRILSESHGGQSKGESGR